MTLPILCPCWASAASKGRQLMVCGITQDQRAALVVSAADGNRLCNDLAFPGHNICHRPRRYLMELLKR